MEEGRPYLFRWPGLPEFLPGFQGVCQCWVFCGVQVFPWWSSATSGVVPITVLEPAYLLWPPLGPGETHILFPQPRGSCRLCSLPLTLPSSRQALVLSALSRTGSVPTQRGALPANLGGCVINSLGSICARGWVWGFLRAVGLQLGNALVSPHLYKRFSRAPAESYGGAGSSNVVAPYIT